MGQSNAVDTEVEVTNKGIIYIGSRFQQNLLTNGNFYKELGFQTLAEIRARGSATRAIPTCLRLKSSSDAQQLNVFRLYSVTLVPQDSTKTIPQLGNSYKTRFPASCALTEMKARDVLYGKQFVFGEGDDAVTYVVEEDSMMLIRSKASAAHIAKVSAITPNENTSWEDFSSG